MVRFFYSILTFIFILSCASNAANNNGRNGIHHAVANNQLSEVKKYVDNGDIELRDSYGFTPLILASYWGHPAIVKYLCEKGAKVDKKDNSGSTALMYAAYYNFIEVTRILLDHNDNKNLVNKRDNGGWTALMFAASRNFIEITRILLDHNANKDLVNSEGLTALYYAEKFRHGEIEMLLNPDAENSTKKILR